MRESAWGGLGLSKLIQWLAIKTDLTPTSDLPAPMAESHPELRNQYFAAALGYLIPGAGHFYQGRTFKGVLYMVCILGTFLYGMSMAEWKAVYYQTEDPMKGRRRTYGYFAQLGVGLPALYAFWQWRRYNAPGNDRSNRMDEPLDSSFKGELTIETADGQRANHTVAGQISLQPLGNGFEIEGRFTGQNEQGDDLDLMLQGPVTLDRAIGGDPRREVSSYVAQERNGGVEKVGELLGTVPRSFPNWFEAPLENAEVESLSGRLGKKYELALVFTWIAGLLNVLAIWDALEGPAYGIGDEEHDSSDDSSGEESESNDDKQAQPTEGNRVSVTSGSNN